MHSYHPQDSPRRRLRNLLHNSQDADSKKDKHTLIAVIGLLVIAAAAGIWFYTTDDSAGNIVLNVIALRKGPPELVKKSVLITTTNRLVEGLNNKRIQNEWNGLAECMSKGCSDIDYYNFIVTVITQKRVQNSDLIYNLILTNKYWGTNEIIEFSQALTKVDDGVDTLGSREVQKDWSEILECDGKCPEKDDLFFQMIKASVMAE